MSDAADSNDDALRHARVRPDSWLVGALLVLLGMAITAAMPQISGAVRAAVADAAKVGTGSTDAAQRPSVRLTFVGVRAVEPKVAGGHDIFAVRAPDGVVTVLDDKIFARTIDLAARVRERGFSARAPPLRA